MNILVAEDDSTIQAVLKKSLQKMGHSVVLVDNGVEALEVLRSPESPRLAILDWGLPRMSGLEVCRSVREGSDRLARYLIMLTARTELPDIVEGFSVGVNDYISKPFHLEELKARIRVGSDMIELQDTVKRHQQTLFESARMTSLGQMAGGVAHEINNPLTIIYGQMRKLEREVAEAGVQPSETLKSMQSTIQRVERVVKSLLVFAQEAGGNELIPVDLNEILKETVYFFTEKFRNAGIEFELNSGTDPIMVKGRRSDLMQVFVSLINNAYDAVVDLKDARWIRVGLVREGNSATFHVTDSGDGIPKNERKSIFEPFYSTKKANVHHGLGLSVSYGIAQQHSARLFLSEDSRDTRFVMEIPVVEV